MACYKRKRRGNWGTVIGLGANAITGIVQAARERKLQQEQRLRDAKLLEASQYIQDINAAQAFDNQYNLKKGRLGLGLDTGLGVADQPRLHSPLAGVAISHQPFRIASDVMKAVGPSHEQGGIDIDENFDGLAEVEIEGDEVISGHRVFSKRLRVPQMFIDYAKDEGFNLERSTFAKVAESLGRKKDKYEEKLVSYDLASLNTAQLMLDRIENLYNRLFDIQEIVKFSRGG